MFQMAPLGAQDEVRFQKILSSLMEDHKVKEMKSYIQHGAISTYEHCERVARMCYIINKHFGEKADMESLVRTAFLHDFYLYDWHEKKLKNKIHGFTHPGIAAKNAEKYFKITPKEKRAIESHMWPLTLHKIPTSREAWILCMADKYVASIETAMMRK